MDVRRGCLWLVTAGLMWSLAACSPGSTAGGPRFRAASLQPGDAVAIDDSTDEVTLEITSERGIGSVEIERLGRPPETLTVNLQLKGLEELRLSWGDAQVSVYVSSGSGELREEVSVQGGPAATIDDTSPYWMTVRVEAADPTIPLAEGFFAVAAPAAFLQAAPARFSLRWVDFYR